MEQSDQQPSSNSIWVKLGQYIAGQRLSLLAPVVTAILGAVGFWLSPLKERVYDYLYPPRILVSSEIVCLRNPLMRGDTFIVKLHVISEGGSLSPGEIATDVPGDYLELEDGNAVVDLDGTERAKVVTYRFDAVKVGTPHLTYVYRFAKGGKITEDITLSVIDRRAGFPTFGDISGVWELAWNNSVGELTITQQNNRLTGLFSLSDVDGRSIGTGKVSGFAFQDNIDLLLEQNESSANKNVPSMKLYANLLKVSEPKGLTICGRANLGKREAFIGQIVNASASAQEICKGANLIAKALIK
jgi:hypothetical protein